MHAPLRFNGKWVERGDSLDLTFNQSARRRTDLTISWNAKLQRWEIRFALESRRNKWEMYGSLASTR